MGRENEKRMQKDANSIIFRVSAILLSFKFCAASYYQRQGAYVPFF